MPKPVTSTHEDKSSDVLPATPNLLNAARYAAEKGIPVFPVKPVDKVPLLRDWQRVAATTREDPSTVDLIWGAYPHANLGFATGYVFDVLDLDGAQGIENFRRQVPDRYVHEGPIVATGGGGRHLYFAPTGLTVHARPDLGIDWRGIGGFVVGPPSLHRSGGRYLWRSSYDGLHPLPTAPSWLLDYLDAIYKGPRAPQMRQPPRAPNPGPNTRQDIFEAAAESDLDVRSGIAYCWNDIPGSPTQGHFNGNRERSLSLYRDANMFRCHQCGIEGFSDQLKTRTWWRIR